VEQAVGIGTYMSENNSPDTRPSEIDTAAWYSGRFEVYSSFTRLLHATVENLMRAASIDYLSVASRTKSMASFVEKMVRKEYDSPDKVTDLAATRVITFIESDAAAATKLLQGSFLVHPEKSLDKSEELGDSQVGYRSIHLICELGKDRVALPEYKPFKGMLFEIQIRTALQHAWAEIDHDRGYKFSGVLPSELRRRLNLLAGQLELADKEFSRLAHDVDQHGAELRRKEKLGDLDIELSSASLDQFLVNLSKMHSLPAIKKSDPANFATVIDELHRFGIDTLQGVNKLMSREFVDEIKKISPNTTTQIGLLRRAMMYSDINKYFVDAWRGAWKRMARSSRELMTRKWGQKKVESIQEMFLRAEESE
jgi:putative GTP pyrophosphokinase